MERKMERCQIKSACFYVTYITGNFERFQCSNFETNFLKNENFLQKTGLLLFSWKYYKLKKQHFHTKLPCQKPMLRQIEWGVQNWPITQKFCPITLVNICPIDVENKLLRTNFIVVLNGGTTDAAVIKQVVIHVTLLDRDNFETCLTFLTVADLNKSQDASGLKKAFFNFFKG